MTVKNKIELKFKEINRETYRIQLSGEKLRFASYSAIRFRNAFCANFTHQHWNKKFHGCITLLELRLSMALWWRAAPSFNVTDKWYDNAAMIHVVRRGDGDSCSIFIIPYRFNDSQNLITNNRWHSNTKIYICKIINKCQYIFKWKK